mmetsp:Transcript_6734/g.16478  ORF Transcript_6734/g.16478 Transcript_6734/m.16478 type:complete len:142 (+) Transcript_6734:950-1375(+)
MPQQYLWRRVSGVRYYLPVKKWRTSSSLPGRMGWTMKSPPSGWSINGGLLKTRRHSICKSRIFFREAKKAEVNGQMAEAKQLSWKALKLEGVRTRRIESQATVVEEAPKVNKRGDIFPQLHVNMDPKGKTSVSRTAVRLTL